MTAGTVPSRPVLVIACGAIATELVRVARRSDWPHLRIRCLPPTLHNRPEGIVPAVRRELEAAQGVYARVFVAYGDCGTGGGLDRLLADHGVERLPGAHCYEFLSGSEVFAGLAEQEPRSFYLSDYLARNFRRLVIEGLALDRHPGLLPQYFGHYRRLVYLAQTRTPALEELARQHAAFLGLEYAYRYCGDEPLRRALAARLDPPRHASATSANASPLASRLGTAGITPS